MRDRLTDVDALDSRDGQNVAWSADRFVHALQALKRIQLGDASFLQRAVELCNRNLVAVTQRAAEHATDGKPPEIIAVIQIGNQELQNIAGIAAGQRSVF